MEFVSKWMDEGFGPACFYIRRKMFEENRVPCLETVTVFRYGWAEEKDQQGYAATRTWLLERVGDRFEDTMRTGETPWDWMIFAAKDEVIREAQAGNLDAKLELLSMICDCLAFEPAEGFEL